MRLVQLMVASMAAQLDLGSAARWGSRMAVNLALLLVGARVVRSAEHWDAELDGQWAA